MGKILPAEVLSRFVLALDAEKEEDLKTLRSLAVTSSVFLQPCRSRLFYHIKLDHFKNQTRLEPAPNCKTPGEKILDLVNGSPWVAKYVKKISIFDAFYTSWLTDDLKVAEALNKLNLEQIEHFVLHRSYRSKWVMLPSPIKDLIVKICQSPVLVSLSVRVVPISLLGVVRPTLKDLEILEATIANSSDYIEPVPRDSPLNIRSLHIQHAHDLDGNIKWLVNSEKNGVKVDGLEKLVVNFTSERDHGRVSKLLEVCKTSLKTFGFAPYQEISDTSANFFDISGCTALETLFITVDVTTPDFEGRRNCLPWTSNFIQRISKSNVTRVHLLLEWELSDAPGDIRTPNPSYFFGLLSRHLNTIGKTVCISERFPRIQQLDIEIKSTNPDDDDTEYIERFVRSAFLAITKPDLVTLRRQPHPGRREWN